MKTNPVYNYSEISKIDAKDLPEEVKGVENKFGSQYFCECRIKVIENFKDSNI